MSSTITSSAAPLLKSCLDIPQAIEERTRLLRVESGTIISDWHGLRNAGGARDDHAAQLLSRLRPHLADLSELLSIVTSQLDEVIANPYGS